MRGLGGVWWASCIVALVHAAAASESSADVARASHGALSPPRGKLDKEIIRRVITSHLHEIEECFTRALMHDEELSGRVMVQFRIVPSGKVAAASVLSSTLGAPPVEKCIVDAVGTWQFPAPRGGDVIVSYPFVLKDAKDSASEPPRARGGCAERFAKTPSPASRAASERTIDLDDLGHGVYGLEGINAEYAFIPLLLSIVDASSGGPPECREAIHACKGVVRSSRDYALMARACTRCVGDVDSILALPAPRRLAVVLERCDPVAPDRVLDGALAEQREKLDPFAYLLVRDLAGELRRSLERDGSPRALDCWARIRKLIPSIVKGMAYEQRLLAPAR